MNRIHCAALAASLMVASAPLAFAQVSHVADRAPARASSLSLEAGSGRVIQLSGPAANVFVADPKVAEIRPGSATSLFVFGVGPGRTTVAAMDSGGQTIAQYDIMVRASSFNASEAQEAVSRLVRDGHFQVTPQPKGLLLTGSVETPADAARAVSILKGFIGENQAVENQLTVRSATQVNLRVRIVEMSRSVSRSLGVNWQVLGTMASFTTNYALPTSGAGAATGIFAYHSKPGATDVNGFIDALAQDNLARVLAEPNLTVMSGEAGSFLDGGEYPIPVAQQNNTTTIDFKEYGVALRFVPTVLSDGRINLHVSPEVSQLSQTGAVTISASNSTLSIPALTVRRAETSVELGSGQTFAMAGLLSDTVTSNGTGVPLLGDLPVLGTLFRSNAFQRQQTELVILVTPYVVKPVDDPGRLHMPGENYAAPNDLERILLQHQSGAVTPAVSTRIPGDAGFIVQ